MLGLRFSLRWLFGIVSFVALGCGLLIYATSLLSRLTFTLLLVGLMAAVLAAVFRAGERRAFWVGFAGFGFAYIWLICGSWQAPSGNGPLRDSLATTAALKWCREKVPRTTSLTVSAQSPGGMMAGGMGMGEGMMPSAGMMSNAPVIANVSGPPDWIDFSTTGHSLFAFLLAALGGIVAMGCYRKARTVGQMRVNR